jgi:hypothetical protein
MIDYEVKRIPCLTAKEYIIKNHYSHGCHNRPSPCYGLYDGEILIGVLMFATPCSERVRASVFGADYKDRVTELHRLHILDVTPKNTESWFIARCLNLLQRDKPNIRAVISFADLTEGHSGVIYKATNAFQCGQTCRTTFYMDDSGRLRHPRQCGLNISKEMASEMGWRAVRRESKNRYIYIIGNKSERKKYIRLCKYEQVRCADEKHHPSRP